MRSEWALKQLSKIHALKDGGIPFFEGLIAAQILVKIGG
jgi:hypothetical protein